MITKTGCRLIPLTLALITTIGLGKSLPGQGMSNGENPPTPSLLPDPVALVFNFVGGLPFEGFQSTELCLVLPETPSSHGEVTATNAIGSSSWDITIDPGSGRLFASSTPTAGTPVIQSYSVSRATGCDTCGGCAEYLVIIRFGGASAVPAENAMVVLGENNAVSSSIMPMASLASFTNTAMAGWPWNWIWPWSTTPSANPPVGNPVPPPPFNGPPKWPELPPGAQPSPGNGGTGVFYTRIGLQLAQLASKQAKCALLERSLAWMIANPSPSISSANEKAAILLWINELGCKNASAVSP